MAGLFALNVSLKCPGAAANNPASSACNSNVLNAQRRIVSVLPRAHAAAVSGGGLHSTTSERSRGSNCTRPPEGGGACATLLAVRTPQVTTDAEKLEGLSSSYGLILSLCFQRMRSTGHGRIDPLRKLVKPGIGADHGMPKNWRASLPATASYSVSAFKECAVQGMAALTHSES